AGDVVAADARITRADRLLLDRSVLTGESVPEEGHAAPDEPDAALTSRRSIAYAGTSVVGGRGETVVVAIGQETEFGRIAGSLASRERRRSPLQRELDRLVRILLVVAIGLIAFTVGVGFYRDHPLGENLLAGISAAIAAIPEEPPILLAVILGLGAYRLLRRGVLVRRLNAEEILGAVDLVVTDKTGTLTENRLAIASVTPIGSASGTLDGPDARLALLVDALRAEDDAWSHEHGAGRSSFTQALAIGVESAGAEARLPRNDLVATEPFAGSRPYTSTVARRDGALETLAIGAPEVIAGLAAGGERAEVEAWHAEIAAAAERGERVVGVARRRGDGP